LSLAPPCCSVEESVVKLWWGSDPSDLLKDTFPIACAPSLLF
jgi:hypothetical protein